jgi:murein DD-endopeptidase MepM/ murein hydrolase activator NlpD
MSIRDRFPSAKLPRSHYFLTISRGDKVRAFAVRPVLAAAALAAIPLLGVWATGVTAFVALHDQVFATLVTRDAQLQSDYETKLSDARAELDHEKSRQLLDQSAFEGKMRELLSRQARLEQRDAALGALAAEAGEAVTVAETKRAPRAANALAAIQAASGAPADSDTGAVRAFAPLNAPARAAAALPSGKPRPLDGASDTVSRVEPSADRLTTELTAAAGDSSLDPTARVGLVNYSLDRVERQQIAAVASVDKAARAAAQRYETVIARTGLSLAALKAPEGAKPVGGVGGPYIPLDGDDAFGRAASDAARQVAAARRLRELMPHIPLRYPLSGEVSMSSPFGYRPDPFLGRPALHPGVDLVQAYGSEIKATALGRVIHAGPMGGYGNAVDIDHGNGIVTRYGHMAEVLATEGQTVKAGDAIGRIGSTGRSTGPHLHYEVRIDGEPVDPERFLTAARD